MHKDHHASDLIRDADDAAIEEAARILRAGGLVAFPTETVYGLGADATDDEAVAGIFAAKARPQFNPLIVHVPDAETAAREAVFDARAAALTAEFWPGPLSLVLPRAAHCRVSLLCSAGLPSLALRAPNHPLAQKLLRAVDRPIAAPSANRSGRISPTTANHVAEGLGNRVAMILDGGACQVGLESAVLDLSGEAPVLLRPGGVTCEALERVIGPVSKPGPTTPLASPGMLASHYAPGLPLRMNARDRGPGEALLAFGPVPRGMEPEENLSPGGDLTEASARLFAALHRLDRPEFTGIAVMPIPDSGLGAAINDRLRRAAAPRP
jgi:L-threonylcarbamoyladenylate synthase